MINNFKDNPVAAAYVAMYEKQNTVDTEQVNRRPGERVDADDYTVTSEKSSVSGGHRAKVVHKAKGTLMYLSQHSYNSPKDAMAHASAYLSAYEKFGPNAAEKAAQDFASKNKDKLAVKESVDELEEATDLTKVSTDKLQAMWNSHKDEERPSPALAAQLKKISAELAQRKKSNMKERAKWVPEEISDEGVADFMGAAAAAAKKGDKTFKFGDKEYKVTMKKSTADAISEFTDKEIKMAYGVLNDPRYKGGNLTGAISAIEKIKKGLSNHPGVKKAMKATSESVDLDEATYMVTIDKGTYGGVKSDGRPILVKAKSVRDATTRAAMKVRINPKLVPPGGFNVKVSNKESVDANIQENVMHDRYMRAHGKKAQGSGRWAFTTKRMGDPSDNEMHIVAKNTTLTDAAKEAMKALNNKNIYVMEETQMANIDEQRVDEITLRMRLAAMGAASTEIEKYAKEKGGVDKEDMLRVAMFLGQGNMKGAVDYAKTLDTDPRDFLLNKIATKVGK